MRDEPNVRFTIRTGPSWPWYRSADDGRLGGAIATPESDPAGRSPHQPGAKLDAGKLRADLMLDGFPRALTAVAEVATYGATKYTPHGWVDDGYAAWAPLPKVPAQIKARMG